MKGKKNLKRPAADEESNGTTEIKKPKLVAHSSHKSFGGIVLILGQGDVGQLGLGEDVMERKKPALVHLPEPIIQAEAGGMHTVCLGASGSIYTFGCNDEGALGRDTKEEGSETLPAKVNLAEKVVQISAGDSHTAALTADGRVFLCGSFRDNNGVIGLLEPMKNSMVPIQVPINVPVVKIASERLLIPQCVHLKAKGYGRVVFEDVFCGAYFTFAISQEGHVYGFGLSNYHQLGTKTTNVCYAPLNLTSFKNSTKSWVGFSGGQHHTVCVDSEGNTYSLGRADYGRLGHGENASEKNEPTPILNLPKVASVACGTSVSYAVSRDGCVFSWGMGTNQQLGTGEEDDVWSPFKMTGKQLESREVLSVSSGGQHTVLLVKDCS